ncbi:hypothetical protein [Streptomyces californicus]|uniref:hypothetical protein n=1 Tax=Streptomyces californicus TaxID=67351 RepID=UPI00067DF045|nr:hypothetical protein [Streptomyces californicus]
MKVYERTENGTATQVSVKEGLAEINDAMMAGKRGVRTMSSISRTDYAIEYKDGRSVRLVQVDAPEESADEDSSPWAVASHRMLLHKFTEATENGRAVCNRSFRPWRYGNGYDFKTRTEREASQYADLYTFCPRCDAK